MTWETPTKPWDTCTPTRQAALRQAWSTGNLRWKLDPNQQTLYDEIYASHKRVEVSALRGFGLDVSRQVGKDFLMSVLAIETAMRRRKRTRIPYGAPTKDALHEILVPTFEAIFEDCPPELLPNEIKRGTFRTNAKSLTWDWGAKIVLVGVDLHPDWLRGPATYAFFLTETGFMPNLHQLMEGVLYPQLLTMTEGFYVMASTPPESPNHEWSTHYLPGFKKAGMYAKRIITDCPRFDPAQVAALVEKGGGMTATRVRREYFCEHIVEEGLAVVPEFDSRMQELVVTTEGFDTPPPFRDTYVSLDPGFDHATGACFAWYDFKRDLVMVEGDFAVTRFNSEKVARLIRAREWQLWGYVPQKPEKLTDAAWADELTLIRKEFYLDTPTATRPVQSWQGGQLRHKPYLRVSDTDARLIADMANDYGIYISATAKDDASSALNSLRTRLHKYRIHPRCTSLIAHLSQGVWTKGRTKLAEQTGGGHFDCIPAMVYQNRNIDWGRNPNPPYEHNLSTHHVPKGRVGNPSLKALASLFQKRRFS